jgi:hypothetical protein
VRLTISEAWGPFSEVRTLWGSECDVDDDTVTLSAPSRDVTVIALEP